jgi:hypothetical protein
MLNFFKSIFHLNVTHFVKLDILCKYKHFYKFHLILLSNWDFFNILNIKSNIIIILINVQKK